MALSLLIRNARNFDYDNEDTQATMQKDYCTRMNFSGRLLGMKIAELEADDYCAPMSAEERKIRYTAMADEAFDEE